jgi:flagella basal body P-ring formation protein FlgA
MGIPLRYGGALLVFAAMAPTAQADVLLAARTMRAGTAIGPADVVLTTDTAPFGAASMIEEAIGQEARVTLYAGRPIPLASLGPPAMVERNQLVTLLFQQGGLNIRAEGRALARGAEGDEVRIMNLGSRSTVFGVVAGPGLVVVP